MTVVSVLYAAMGGTEQYKLAEVLWQSPHLEHVRVRLLSTGAVRHVHRNSIVWGVA